MDGCPGLFDGVAEVGLAEGGFDDELHGALEEVQKICVEAVVDADVRRIGIRKERDEEIGAALSG